MSSLSTRILLGRTARAAPGAGGAPAPSPLRPACPPTRGTLLPPSDSRAKAEAGQNQPSPQEPPEHRDTEASRAQRGAARWLWPPREQRMSPGPCYELAQASPTSCRSRCPPHPTPPSVFYSRRRLCSSLKGQMKRNRAKPSRKAPGRKLAPLCAGAAAAESQQPRPASPVHVVVAMQVQDPGGQLAGHALQGEGVRRQGLRHPAATQIALEVSLPRGATASPACGAGALRACHPAPPSPQRTP